ncbi:MAG: response regulator transcription factor [Microscillaceae bacterium]|nr:response regulator transcription factor [Microscillaceae bacterium]
MKAIIIDDEIPCAQVLQIQLRENCPEVQVMALIHDSRTACQVLPELQPDLVFLDIEMPNLNGFQLLDMLPSLPFSLIFTTAYNQFALEAFNYAAVHYLLKPIDDLKLIDAVSRAQKPDFRPITPANFSAKVYSATAPEKIALPYQDGYTFVKTQDIIYCEADNNYTRFHLDHQRVLLSAKNLGTVEELLREASFFASISII